MNWLIHSCLLRDKSWPKTMLFLWSGLEPISTKFSSAARPEIDYLPASEDRKLHSSTYLWHFGTFSLCERRSPGRHFSFDRCMVRFSQIENASCRSSQLRLRQHAKGRSVCVPLRVIAWLEWQFDQPKDTIRGDAHEAVGDAYDGPWHDQGLEEGNEC